MCNPAACVAENSYFLDSHQQAERFHRALLNQFMRVTSADAQGFIASTAGNEGELIAAHRINACVASIS